MKECENCGGTCVDPSDDGNGTVICLVCDGKGVIVLKKYEYCDVPMSQLTKPHYTTLDVNKLNELGSEGWEFVIINGGSCIFKREVIVDEQR